MHLFLTLSTLLVALTHASPIIYPRAGAGGPIVKPIPQTCTVSTPLVHNADTTNCSNNITTNTADYKPTTAFASAHSLYEAYFDLPKATEELWTQCSQQCYGYGDEGDCRSAVFAQAVPVPEGYFGAEGGELVSACLLFDEYLAADDLEKAVEGQWIDERAGNIYC